jgi:hypothetical protein
VGGPQAAPDQERHLAHDRGMPVGKRDDDVRGDLHHLARLRGLGRRRVRTALDNGDSAEDLPGTQQLENNILACAGMAHDPDAPCPHEAEPQRGIALVEDELARSTGHLAGRSRERLELGYRKAAEDGTAPENGERFAGARTAHRRSG